MLKNLNPQGNDNSVTKLAAALHEAAAGYGYEITIIFQNSILKK